jgi:hypothetical protein
VIAAERIAGIHSFTTQAETEDQPDVEASGTMVNLLWGSSQASVGGINPYAVPSLSIHGVLGPGVTLGGLIGYVSAAGETETRDPLGDKVTTDHPTTTGFVVAPRAGFILPTSESLSLWLRGGLTYYQFDTSSEEARVDFETQITESGLALSLDPMLLFTPVPHVGILLGPVLDVGLSGEVTVDLGGADSPPEDPDPTDVKLSNYGVTAGIAILL